MSQVKFNLTGISNNFMPSMYNIDSTLWQKLSSDCYSIDKFKKGNKIRIKKKNRGKFTESAKRAGMGVQEYARHILANKDKYSPTLVKRANFTANSRKWKH